MQDEKFLIKGEFSLSKRLKRILLCVASFCCIFPIVFWGILFDIFADTFGVAVIAFYEVVGILLFLLFFYLKKAYSQLCITVTNRRIYGRYSMKNKIDLPLDSISAVTYNSFSEAIVVTTPTGLISICQCVNREAVYETITQLLIERQNKNNSGTSSAGVGMHSTDELKKYKELLDSGVITQEEFDAKKKQLLGL